MRNFRILFVLILLALVPVSGAWSATARSPREDIQKRPQAGVLSLRLQILQQLWVGFWTKAGCGADPWGLCGSTSTSQTQSVEGGCDLEPLGLCRPGH